MTSLAQNKYKANITRNPADISAAQELRRLCFASGSGLPDGDEFDANYQHVLIYDDANALVCTYRFLHLPTGRDVEHTYSAVFYGLTALYDIDQPMIEMGRFCIHPDCNDPDILRFAWSILTKYVDQNDISLLFGCSSFQGTDVTPYAETFALLKHRYLAPEHLAPSAKACDVHAFGEIFADMPVNTKTAIKAMPPLLRTYLAMGGRVSDHAVIDHEMNTTHVFTAVEIDEIPASRKRWLRASVA